MSCNYLLIPQVKVNNANAQSSPFTIGFPAVTAFLGFSHALHRKLNNQGYTGINLSKTGITSHEFELQTYKGDFDEFNSIVIQKSSPYSKEDFAKFKQSKPPSFIENPRCHMTVSLVIELTGDIIDEDAFLTQVTSLIHNGMKLAGGDIISFEEVRLFKPDDERKLIRHLMPGYSLIQRTDLIEAHSDECDAIDQMLNALSVQHQPQLQQNGDHHWRSFRQQKGWIVPISSGFMGITEVTPSGQTKNQRDINTPHVFAENIVTLGEFIMPYTLASINEMLFTYTHDKEKSLYLCEQPQNLKMDH